MSVEYRGEERKFVWIPSFAHLFFFFLFQVTRRHVLLKTKETAEVYLESTLNNTVVIVPAYFNVSQKAGHEGYRKDLRIEFSPDN